jgi:hypothetical protein
MRQLFAQKTAGTLQALLRFFVFAVKPGEKNLGMGIVTRYFHAGDGNQAHTRIVDFEAHQLGYFALDLLANPVSPGEVAHYSARATSTIS